MAPPILPAPRTRTLRSPVFFMGLSPLDGMRGSGSYPLRQACLKLPKRRKAGDHRRFDGLAMAKRSLDDTDRKMIALLRANARTPTAALARSLGLSRSAVQERLRRLERDQVIRGYTLTLGDDAARGGANAHGLQALDPKQLDP